MVSVRTFEISLPQTKETDILDLTDIIQDTIADSGFSEGMVLVFMPGSTGALTTIEYEPGLLKDFPSALDRLFPRDIEYRHEAAWHDGNGHSHIRASFIGPDLVLPFRGGQLLTGTWQQPIFIELDNKPRKRHLIIQVWGE